MRIPYVIDNYEPPLADVLKEVLAEPEGGAYASAKRDVLGTRRFGADPHRVSHRWSTYIFSK